ncbi:4-hydroxy-tetrahydrodipicolinate synthase [Methylophilaceae bacterium]|nr:4-hydroxy-tetrahydrodipicolinate synthase [Methylophilaceae bacterium]
MDYESLRKLIDFHCENSSDGIVVVGTSGESPTITFEEHTNLIKETIEYTSKRLPVIAGTGANSTEEAIFLTNSAKELGADAALIVAPYYNKPPQEGLYRHFKKINDEVDIPQILYNVPSRTCSDIENKTVIELSKLRNIIGIKDATGDLSRIETLKNEVVDNFLFYSGDDATACDFLKLGGHGVISVTANIKPREMSLICHLNATGKFDEANYVNQQISELHEILFVESNPIPVKYLLSKMGLIKSGIRLPLIPLNATHHKVFEKYV